MLDSLTAVADKFARWGDVLDGSELRRVTERVAMGAKGDMLEEVARDAGHDRKLSGWGRFRLGARFDLVGNDRAELYPTPAGPSATLAFGRRQVVKLPKRASRKVYATPQGPRTATRDRPFTIGTTRGKGTYSRAVRTIQHKTPGRVQREIRRSLSEVFGT